MVRPAAVPPQLPKDDPLIGREVGKYKIVGRIAAGGMGRIYRAEQLPLGRTVALKVLLPQREPDDSQFKKRFFREASILARLQHPNIVTLFDYGAIEGLEPERYYISMEFLQGETLSRRLAKEGPLSVRHAVRIGRQIASGLSEAHAQGVVHRDLKPSNVMLLAGRDGEDLVKILDFGIGKVVGDEDAQDEITQDGAFIGSPRYMSPEQIGRNNEIDARTDVYALGIILYQCLTGTVPFDAATSVQTLIAHLNEPPKPLNEVVPDVPDWLARLVMGCIEKNPDKRPQTMELVAHTLAEGSTASFPGVLPRSSNTASGATSSLRAASPPRSKRRFVFFTLAVAVLGGAAVFVGMRPDALEKTLHRFNPAPPSVATASRFMLRIESSPSGADVAEGDHVLGATPLDVPIDNDAVRQAPRSFMVTKDGYLPYSLVQGPSEDAVHVVAPLATAPASSGTTSASAPPSPPSTSQQQTSPAPVSRPHYTPAAVRAPPRASPGPAPKHGPDDDIPSSR